MAPTADRPAPRSHRTARRPPSPGGTNGQCGALSFKSPPDFEAPTDANGDNVYVVIVRANDGSLTNLHALLVSVTNVVNESLPGDYNRSGVVDAADYVVWRRSRGQVGVGLPADGNGNGQIDDGDYNIWRANFGRTAAATVSAASFLDVAPAPQSGPSYDDERQEIVANATGLSAMSTTISPGLVVLSATPVKSRLATQPILRREPAVVRRSLDQALVAWLDSKSTAREDEPSNTSRDDFQSQTDDRKSAAEDLAALELAFAAF